MRGPIKKATKKALLHCRTTVIPALAANGRLRRAIVSHEIGEQNKGDHLQTGFTVLTDAATDNLACTRLATWIRDQLNVPAYCEGNTVRSRASFYCMVNYEDF